MTPNAGPIPPERGRFFFRNHRAKSPSWTFLSTLALTRRGEFPEGSPSGNPIVCPQSGVYCQERVWFSRPWEVKSNLPQTASRAREHHTDAVLR